ncbi:MAG: hypothetical protein HY257_03920, partial [Chloroflexi bacterium]|nr:hypothetical protein [Chloroflexota bacterium]
MSETFRCPTCKAAVRVDAKFCGKCGRVFKPRGTFAPIENAPALNLATAPSSVAPEKRIGNYRIVGTWRRAEDFDARVYEVHARTIDDVPPRGLAIEEHQPLSSAMLKQFQALSPHPNLAAILDQSTDDAGNYFLIVEYVAGPLLNQLPVPAPDAAAVQLARELVLIVNDLNERGWGLQAARFWAAESLNRFQKAFALNA